MKVVFFEDVEGTADVGDVKDVKNGFARNYLLPRGIAAPATKNNLFRAKSVAEREARHQAKLDEDWSPIAERIEGHVVTVEARVGETGRLFGSVTNRDIAEKLTEAMGQEIDSRAVLLAEPLRDLGSHPVTVRLTRNLRKEITVEVTPDEASQAIVARLEAEREAQEEQERRDAEARAYQREQEAKARGEFVPDEATAEAMAQAEVEGVQPTETAETSEGDAETDESAS